VIEIADQDTADNALSFLDEWGRSDAALCLADPAGRAAIAYGVFGIPETFFIDADGTVVGKAIGATDAFRLESTIDAALRGDVRVRTCWEIPLPAPPARSQCHSILVTSTGSEMPFRETSRYSPVLNLPPASSTVSLLARISHPSANAAIRAALCTSPPPKS
jgi:hypothetical protein